MAFKSKYTGNQIENLLDSINNKQDKLISGSNIKTINDQSLLGSGNIVVEGVTTSYVDNAIANAITNTLNTPV